MTTPMHAALHAEVAAIRTFVEEIDSALSDIRQRLYRLTEIANDVHAMEEPRPIVWEEP